MIEIPLTRGLVAVVDDQDADLRNVKWRAHVDKNCNSAYAVREIVDPHKASRRSTERMHRVVMSRCLGRPLTDSEEIDHANTDGLDNRRSNLRLVSRSQNLQNTPRRRDNTSGYKGVTYHKYSKKWHAVIHKDGKTISLKYHDTPESAFAAYKAAAKELFGEYANLGE